MKLSSDIYIDRYARPRDIDSDAINLETGDGVSINNDNNVQ